MHCVSREAEESTASSVKAESYRVQSKFESPTMSPISDMPASALDEFSGEASAFGACEGNNNGQDYEEDSKSSTLWELMMTMYLPLAALWLRRSVFGISMLVRTVILGHLLRLAFGNFSEWMNEKSPSWIQTLWQPIGPHTKPDSKAWPPPALTVLALFTVITLVVHPDGFTWIMLGKAKNAIFSMFNSLSECWQLLITDYGVMPSIIALFTLAALIFLLFIMLRSITPRRTRRAPPVQDKKKKKRKGQGRHRGISGKIKSAPSTRSRAAGASVPQTSREATSPVRSLGDNAPDLTPLTPSSSVHNAKSSGSSIKVEECNRELNDLPESYACPTPILPIASKTTFEKDLRRTRVPSVSTLDTTAMSDDLSCGSISIRSLPSVGVSTSTALSCPVPPEQKPFMLSATPSTTISEDHKLKAGVSNPRRNKRLGNTSAKTKMNPSKCIEGPSRWDALKPTPAVKHVHQQAERQKPSGKAVEKVSHIQHQPPSAPRVSNRRAGRGGGGPKKGRGGNHQHASTSGNRNSVSRSPTQPDRLATTQSPVSPPSIEHQDTSRFSFPAFDSLPPPPPGLGSTLLFTNDRLNEDSRLFPVQQNSFSGGRSLLPPSQGHPMPARSWDLAPEQPNAQEWHNPAPFGSSPTRIGTSSRFHGSPAGSLGYGVVKENPFAPDTVTETTRGSDEQIEADLQELGGQMVGSILDF